jgi:hypothetical protein
VPDLSEILLGMDTLHHSFADRMRTHSFEKAEAGEEWKDQAVGPDTGFWVCADCRMELYWDGDDRLCCNLDNETCPAAVMKEALE